LSQNQQKNSLLQDTRQFLRWQKHLGLAGLPQTLMNEALRESTKDASRVAETEAEPERDIPVSQESSAASVEAVPEKKEEIKKVVSMGKDMFVDSKEFNSLEEIQAELGDCKRCKLHEDRNKIVFGEGSANARIMFIGEGPGRDEDLSGRPFVGRAGKLLTDAIEKGMGIQRSEVYIGNIVKCRPPNNRDPEPDESEACIGFLKAQIRVIKPEVIVLLGRVPMNYLLGEKTGITKVHGNWYEYEGIRTMPVFHPSYLLRSPSQKRPFWEDLKKVMNHLGIPIPAGK